jgi:type IV secretory pathway VirJ component
MKKLVAIVLTCLVMVPGSMVYAQDVVAKLPVEILPGSGDTSKSLIIYASGDGGITKFTQKFIHTMADNGYPVVALNSNKYFWDEKTPEQTTTDIALLIKYCQLKYNRSKIVLVGYSFGADVMPFVYNRLPREVASAVQQVILLSPSANADFEIHLNVMMGARSKGPVTLPEINKMTGSPVVLLLEDKKEFPVNQVTIKNYMAMPLPHTGGKESNAESTCNWLLQYLGKKA